MFQKKKEYLFGKGVNMSKGKKLLVLTLFLTIVSIVLCINKVNLVKNIPDEYYNYYNRDYEVAGEYLEQWVSEQSILNKISYNCLGYVEIITIMVAVMSIVSLLKNKETGCKIVLLLIVIICGVFVYSDVASTDMSKMEVFEEEDY